MKPSHSDPASYNHPILSEEEILALRSEAALLLHNELRDASSQTLRNNEFHDAQTIRIKRNATLALLESFIASALGGHAPKINGDVISRHSDEYARSTRTTW